MWVKFREKSIGRTCVAPVTLLPENIAIAATSASATTLRYEIIANRLAQAKVISWRASIGVMTVKKYPL